ncbi:MAG: tetratricopeptide repeat protein [Betaproteobacteria bacterium]|nr:MAG: tetratricopeptide repeat protein [Betaproteobacteria bacterium]
MRLPRWLRGEDAAAWLERGARSEAQGDLADAVQCYQRAFALDPDSFEAARALAFGWARLGDVNHAEHFAAAALKLDATSVPLQLLRGDLLREQGRLEDALAACEEAVRLAPDLPQARNNFGNALRDIGRTPEAIAQFRAGLALDRTLPELHFNLALSLQLAGELDEAEAHYRSAAELKQDFAQAWLNLASLCEQRDDVQGALDAYRNAIRSAPDEVAAHVNYAQHLLRLGRFDEGWKEYEWRWRLPEMAAWAPRFDKPQWEGGELAGETVLVYAEQGFGDAIHFARYVPLIARRGGKPAFRCPAPLKALFARAPGMGRVFDEREPPPPFDLCCPLLSLPRLFGTRLDNVPADVPYVHADPDKVRQWQGSLASQPALHVGLAWTTDSKIAQFKTMPLDALAPLGRIPGVVLHSLQTGAAAAEADRPPSGMALVNDGSRLRDFSDTAALIANLDLVISIDTAVVHVAGALAKPIWTLLAEPADWRWLVERDDSPWYPTMRLFRRARGMPWNDLIQQVAKALNEWRNGRGGEI